MKTIRQTKQNKEKLHSSLIAPLLSKNCTREELVKYTGWTDTYVRNEIRYISMFYPVISYSTKKGYRICNTKALLEENNEDKINFEKQEINHTLNEINSRINVLKKRQRALIGALKVLEKGKQDNEENI